MKSVAGLICGRLLQCLAVRHCRRPTSATAISPERSCASGDWNPAHRPHYAGSPVSSLAADATTRHFQVGDTGSQVLERPSTRLSGRRLPSCGTLAGRGRPGSRSAASMIPRTTTSLGDRAFAVAGPRVWNSLPPAIRHCRCQSSESC